MSTEDAQSFLIMRAEEGGIGTITSDEPLETQVSPMTHSFQKCGLKDSKTGDSHNLEMVRDFCLQ